MAGGNGGGYYSAGVGSLWRDHTHGNDTYGDHAYCDNSHGNDAHRDYAYRNDTYGDHAYRDNSHGNDTYDDHACGYRRYSGYHAYS